MNLNSTIEIFAATGLALAFATSTLAEDIPARQVTVDATVTVGALRPFSGVRAADGDAAGMAFYRAARVDLVRIQDAAGIATLDALFPDVGADADDPKSYRFASTDRRVATIKSAGAEPLFTLRGGAGATAPDPDKWAQIVRHVVLHYNAGWNKGYRNQIRYWEIWDAPDLETSWRATPQEYYVLYAKAAHAIQAADDSALVGGPGLSRPLIAGPYREKFFDFVRVNRLPLDFFSWHFRSIDSNDPYLFVAVARELRTILDARGFGSTRSILAEWGEDPGEELSEPARAAFAASALIYMLGGPIDHQTRDPGEAAFGNADRGAIGNLLALFGSLKGTPQLLRTTGGDESGFAVLGARSADKRLIHVLISNYQVPAKFLTPRGNWDTSLPERRVLHYQDNGGYDAAISVPSASKYRVTRFRSNDGTNFTRVDQSVQSGPTLRVQAALPPPAVDFIVINAK